MLTALLLLSLREVHETGGGAARKLAQMLAPHNY